jgi:hypothetical protein
VSDDWGRFAAENGAPDLGSQVIGRSIWEFVDENAQSHDWRSIFRAVRETGETAWIPHRSDSPELERVGMAAVSPGEGRELTVTWWFTQIRPCGFRREEEGCPPIAANISVRPARHLNGARVRDIRADSILFLCQEVGGSDPWRRRKAPLADASAA